MNTNNRETEHNVNNSNTQSESEENRTNQNCSDQVKETNDTDSNSKNNNFDTINSHASNGNDLNHNRTNSHSSCSNDANNNRTSSYSPCSNDVNNDRTNSHSSCSNDTNNDRTNSYSSNSNETNENETNGNDSNSNDANNSNDSKEKEGVINLENNSEDHHIFLISIIGEIEGHETLAAQSKSTKYEVLLPKLASIEDDKTIDGIIVLLNTMGGDVEAGLAIAEMIASLSKPSVSLVLGGSHSIGVPIAVSTDYSFIVPSGTMVIHPVRMTGTVIGAPQTYKCFHDVQNRIIDFVCEHSKVSKDRLNELMMETEILTKDIGSVLCGEEAVKEGIIDEVGGIAQAIQKVHEMIDNSNNRK